MTRHLSSLTLLLTLAACSGAVSPATSATPTQTPAQAEESASRDIYVPTTISAEAQQVLQALIARKPYTRQAAKADDIEGWRKVHAGTETMMKAPNEAAVKATGVTVTDAKIGGVPVLDIRPAGWKDDGKVLIYTHGGAYTLFSARSTLGSSAVMSAASNLRVISIDYTTSPNAQWKEIQDQVIAVYKALLADGHKMENLAMYGDSAGGGLATSTILNLRDQGLGMPAVVVLWSPWVDITNAGDTAHTLADADPTLSYDNLLGESALAYAGETDLADPHVSPIHADFSKGFPPSLIQAGTKEIFLSTAVRFFQTLEAAGMDSTLDVYEGMWHIFQQAPIPETRVAVGKSAAFIRKHLDLPPL